jgi:hypothetical protein
MPILLLLSTDFDPITKSCLPGASQAGFPADFVPHDRFIRVICLTESIFILTFFNLFLHSAINRQKNP